VKAIRFAAPLAVSFLLSACISPLPDDPLIAQLEGAWSGCRTDATGDLREEIRFSGRSLSWTVHRHSTADASCGGTGDPESSIDGTYVAGDLLFATIGSGGERVLAQGLDVTHASGSFYTTVYLNDAASPAALFLGDPDASPTYNMSSGDKRPIVLIEDPLQKQ
jgi:hypothetical protein